MVVDGHSTLSKVIVLIEAHVVNIVKLSESIGNGTIVPLNFRPKFRSLGQKAAKNTALRLTVTFHDLEQASRAQ